MHALPLPQPQTFRARVRCLVASLTTFSSTASPLRRRTCN